jgi:hypothetical protein
VPGQDHVAARPEEWVQANNRDGITDAPAEIYDNSGKMLYNMADKLISLHKTITCEGAHGKEVLSVKKKWSSEYTETCGSWGQC